ncbi:MAG: hypothetical protein U1E65_19175 [Myxococcota bacterium]
MAETELEQALPLATIARCLGRTAFSEAGDATRWQRFGGRAAWMTRLAEAPPSIRLQACFGERAIGVPRNKLEEALSAGATVRASGVEALLPSASEALARLGRALGFLGRIRVDLEMAAEGGTVGAAPESSIHLVAEGEASWTLAEGPSRVEAGGLIHVPAPSQARGLAHRASLVFSLVFEDIDLATLLERVLWRETGHLAEWRHVRPLLGEQGLFGGPSKQALLELDQRLEELAGLVAGWRADPLSLVRGLVVDRWRGAERQMVREFSDESPLRLSDGALVLSSAPGRCSVVADGNEIETEGQTAEILRAAIAAQPIAPVALHIPGVHASTTRATLRALFEAGVLVQ